MANSSYGANQVKSNCNGTELRRNPNELQMSSQLMDSGNQNVANLLLQSSQGTATNPILSYQSSSFSGLYGSPGFNSSLTGYENNLQWLTDNRIQNQHNQLSGSLITDKSTNTSTHSLPPTTSHSCCVNRFSMLDSMGMGSPLPNEQVKSACDVPSFQNKSNLTMNMIDPIQSWLNLQMPSQIPNNQQYCKYSERSVTQNYNIPVSMPSQMSLPLIDQSELKQTDMCIQSLDTCFENENNNTKHIDSNVSGLKPNSFSVENKQGMVQENPTMLKQQQSSYQSSLMSKDWKSTFQTMQNYISSPNVFGPVSDSQENFLFAQYSMPPANSYYSPTDNYSSFVNKNSACMSQTKNIHNRIESNTTMENSFNDQNKLYNSPQGHINGNSHYLPKPSKETGKVQLTLRSNGNIRPSNYSCSMSDCCQIKKSQGKSIGLIENNRFAQGDSGQESKNGNGNQSSVSLDPDNQQNDKRGFKSSEAVTSESDESNIIVEESDDIGEIESEISIEEIKKSYQASEPCSSEVLLRCLVCNTPTSSHTPANQFIHMNESFPLTTSSRTPVRTKLTQILPLDLQQCLKLHNSFMCRRCLNLIETIEVLEMKLATAKQTISDQFSKTVQHLMPEVEQLLQEDAKVSKTLSAEDGDKISKSFVEMEVTVENEYRDDDKAVINSDPEVTAEFKCSYCSKVLSSQINLNLHLQHHTKEFRFYCERCGKGFPLKSTLETHLKWHNSGIKNVQVLCEICGDMFSSKHLLCSHQLKAHNGSFHFKCETCGKGFTRKVSLEIHSHKHTGVRPFICEYCGRTFTSESNLKSHIRVCTKDFPHKCDVCGKSFVLESQLMRHKSQHNGVYKLTCSVCGKGFNKPADLSYHMRAHSSDKQFKCTDCDKTFKTLYNLNYHTKVVHKEEVFKCAVCGRVFTQNLLSEHMNSHTNEKPYECGQCDKSFAHQTTFITHLKTHTEKVKMKICQVCGKSIKTRLSVHMRTHTGEKPYKCTSCPLAFTVGISLKKHFEAKHCKTK